MLCLSLLYLRLILTCFNLQLLLQLLILKRHFLFITLSSTLCLSHRGLDKRLGIRIKRPEAADDLSQAGETPADELTGFIPRAVLDAWASGQR